MSKGIKKVAKFALPVAAAFAAPYLAPALGIASTAGTAALGGGLGALGGAVSGGGLKGALMGALGGAGGSLLTGALGGVPAASSSIPGASGQLGSTLSALKSAAVQGGSSGGLGGLMSNLSSIAQPASTVLGGLQNVSAQDKMKKQLLAQQQRSEQALQPYLNSGAEANSMLSQRLSSGDLGGAFKPQDLQNDPGYQFNLTQGQQAIDRAQSARGGIFSGAALKEASDYATGLAENTYQNAFNRDQQRQNSAYNMLAGQSGQGLNAAGAMTGVYDNIGNINANNTLARNNTMTGTLSALLRGGVGSQIVGYRTDGTPIYAGEETDNYGL